jgi:hypothetical protein
MWEFKGGDLVLNAFRTIERSAAIAVSAKFAGWVRKVASQHPCEVNDRNLTRMMHDGEGDQFILLLPALWFVAYRISPNCAADSGSIEFIEVGTLN